MNTFNRPTSQNGAVLLIALIFLTVMSLLGATIMNNSFLELRMAGNAQDYAASLHEAQAGLDAVMSLLGSSKDPFTDFNQYATNSEINDVFTTLNITTPPFTTADKSKITTNITQTLLIKDCPRSEIGDSLSIKCNYYDVESTHNNTATAARTNLHLGVIQQIPTTN